MADDPKTYTQEEVDALIADRNKALEAKRDEALTEAKNAKKALKAYEGIGDAEEARKALAELADLRGQKKAEKAGITAEELNKLKADMRKELEGEYSPFKTTAEKLASENRMLKLDNVVKQQMGRGGVRSERLDALYKLTGDRFDLTEDGKPILKENAARDLDKYVVEDLSKEYPEFFNGSGSSGGGAPKSNAGGGGVVRTIPAGDQAAFLANAEGIAKGTVVVR